MFVSAQYNPSFRASLGQDAYQAPPSPLRVNGTAVSFTPDKMDKISFNGGQQTVYLVPGARGEFNNFMQQPASLFQKNGTGFNQNNGVFYVDWMPKGILVGSSGSSYHHQNINALQNSNRQNNSIETPPDRQNFPATKTWNHVPPQIKHPSYGTTVTTQGNLKTVRMRNHYFGAAATPGNIQKVNSEIEKYWSGTWRTNNGDPIYIDTQVEATNDMNNVNWVELRYDRFRSTASPWGQSHWSMNPPGGPATWAHEAGHLLGFPDYYVEYSGGYTVPKRGHENDLMATLGPYARVTNEEAQALRR
ncbi:hypothetical protein [Burkholderia ubonensis]|uniref:hypothetical protein n=1 Tax=Burkholderia ubonensis TaxID=101571 RepID=UPI000A579B57|nr:hypothetical protein [Burkholderia ubonensis]